MNWIMTDRNDFDQKWQSPNPATCDDAVWYQFTGLCGGCGDDNCHEGPCSQRECVDPMYGYERLLCDKCQYRHDQGWWL